MKTIYFAHPVSDYNTGKEQADYLKIRHAFADCVILNPNQEAFQDRYPAEGMALFEGLVKSCQMLVAVPFKDGQWGMGVWREAEIMSQMGGEVWELHEGQLKRVDIKNIRPLSINETRERVRASAQLKKVETLLRNLKLEHRHVRVLI